MAPVPPKQTRRVGLAHSLAIYPHAFKLNDKLAIHVVQKAVLMSDKLDNLKKTLQQKQPDSIEQEQFRILMRHIDEHNAGLCPRPTGRVYRAWSAAMMTRVILAKFSAAPAESETLAKPGGTQTMSIQSYSQYSPDNSVPWSTIFTGAATAAALSLLFTKSRK